MLLAGIVMNALLQIQKSTISKCTYKEKKTEGLINFGHNLTVALSGCEAVHALSCVIGRFVIREHVPLFKQTSQCCRSRVGDSEDSGLSYLWTNKLQC